MKKEALFLFTLYTLTAAQDFCYKQGECVGGNVVDLMPGEQTYDECLDFCKSTANCNYFTMNQDTLVCLAFDSCPILDANICLDCHSGEKSCDHHHVCGEPGECNGAFITVNSAEDEYNCIAMCHQTSGCEYYTYYSDSNLCMAYSSCTSFTTSCADCVSGMASCGNVDPGWLV